MTERDVTLDLDVVCATCGGDGEAMCHTVLEQARDDMPHVLALMEAMREHVLRAGGRHLQLLNGDCEWTLGTEDGLPYLSVRLKA